MQRPTHLLAQRGPAHGPRRRIEFGRGPRRRRVAPCARKGASVGGRDGHVDADADANGGVEQASIWRVAEGAVQVRRTPEARSGHWAKVEAESPCKRPARAHTPLLELLAERVAKKRREISDDHLPVRRNARAIRERMCVSTNVRDAYASGRRKAAAASLQRQQREGTRLLVRQRRHASRRRASGDAES
jgi:hypothetical protein